MIAQTRPVCKAAVYARHDIAATHSSEAGGLISGDESVINHSWSALVDDLLSLRDLEDDWDGQGAVAPTRALVDWSIALLLSLRSAEFPPPDRVIAGVNGTVYFEWHFLSEYIEIEAFAPKRAECRRLRDGSTTAEIVQYSSR